MISGDRNLLAPESAAEKRLAMQRDSVDKLDVFVWPQVHSMLQISKATWREKYDVITAQDPFWRGYLAWPLARLTGAKLNIQVHVDLRSQPLWRRWLAYYQLRHADSVRVVSAHVEKQVRGVVRTSSVHVLPIYVDLERFKHVVPMIHDRPTILWIGRFEKEKDPLYAIEVLRQVRSEGLDAGLVMLGAGKLELALRKAAAKLPVEFPGWKPPEDFLRTADVVLSTSAHESWGASIIEALASGVPVVAPDVGVAKEAGAIIAPRAGLAGAVARVLRDKPQGQLQIAFLDKEAWSKRWHETLV